MTVDIGHTTPITLDAMWSSHAPEELREGSAVRLEGQIERINRSALDRKWDTASLKLDGYADRVTLHISKVQKG